MSDPTCLLNTRPPLTRADRERMMEEAERGIKSYVMRSTVPPSRFDDVMQDCRLAVWQVVDKFDPSRGATWSTYLVSVVKRTVLRHLSDLTKKGGIGGTDLPLQFIDTVDGSAANDVTDREPAEEDDHEPDPDAPLLALGEAVRRQLGEPLLAKLKGQAREIVEAIAFERLTIPQVEARTGRSSKDIKLIIRNAVLTMTKPAVKPKPKRRNGRSPSRLADHEPRIRAAVRQHPDWSAARLLAALGLPGKPQAMGLYLSWMRRKDAAKAEREQPSPTPSTTEATL